jgi:hypothetical protein
VTTKLKVQQRSPATIFNNLVLRFIAAFMLKAWRVRNQCKHGGGVGDVSAAQQRGADGSNARA